MMGRLARMARKDKARPRLGVTAAVSLTLFLALLPTRALPAAAQVAPHGDWRTLDTPHFSVTFPASLEPLGRRAALRAERAWAELVDLLPDPGEGRIELLLTDDVDLSNGFATVSPARRVTVYVRPPVDGFALSNFDDWLDLVITHELAHVVHLDATGGLGGLLRRIFGRVPGAWPFFPGVGTPDWTIEGLATWYESSLTGAGRAEGSFFRMMARTAALEGTFETIDRASGRSPQWPGGERSYLYGSLFFRYLLDRYGEGRMELFVDEVGSQWIPYRLDAAARASFGVSFSRAWEVWADSVEAQARRTVEGLEEEGGITEPERLTRDGRLALYARPLDDGTVVFSRADGRSDPQLRIWDPVRGGSRFLARTHGVVRPEPLPSGGFLLAQPEFADPYRIFNDLWRVGRNGELERLTRGARLDQPSVSPDGAWAAAVRYAEGSSALVRVHLATGQVTPLVSVQPGVAWGFPAVSPDGRWVAATRWTPTGADVVILEAETGVVVLDVTRDRALDLAPAWGPSGGVLLWGSDRSGIPQIVEASVDPEAGEAGIVREVTRVVSGAILPAVDPGGGWLHFSLYTSRGWELARIPWKPGTGRPAELAPSFLDPPPVRGTVADSVRRMAEGPSRPYASLPSLRPRFWQPIVLPAVEAGGRNVLDPFLGFGTTATDLVGRHLVSARGAFSLGGGEFDGALEYSYAGLGNPVLGLTVEQEWDASGPFQVQADPSAPPTTLYLREREQRVNLGVSLLRTRWRTAARLGAGAGFVWESRNLLDRDFRTTDAFRLSRPDTRLAQGQLSLTLSSARSHALSLGPEEGATLFLLARTRVEQTVPDSLQGRRGGDRSRDDVLGQVNLYQSFSGPGFGDHVLALRLAGGASWGPGADQLTWEVGGARGQVESVTGLSLFGGSNLFFPVRGFDQGVRAGRLAWAASAEYRFPLALVNRGPGLLPLHLDRLHGAVFLDGGNAWGPEAGLPGYQQPRLDPVASTGIEVTFRTLLLYNVPLAFRAGLAVPLVDGFGARWYLRVGPSF